MKILVVEDEPKLAEYLRRALTESNYIVDVAHSGTDGRYLATEGHYDLVLLDVMLPGLDGYAVLQELRRGKHVPVLMLTARDEVEDRVRGLQAGADDYLVKPFALSELLARVQALLRRGAGAVGLVMAALFLLLRQCAQARGNPRRSGPRTGVVCVYSC